jgi:hypothetical protein
MSCFRHREFGPATKSRPTWGESGSIHLPFIEGNRPTFFLGAEGDEAIQSRVCGTLDCFRRHPPGYGGQVASLAMTPEEGRTPSVPREREDMCLTAVIPRDSGEASTPRPLD